MIFTTFDFLLFLIPVLLGFWLLAEKPVARTVWLLVASYVFYMAGPKTVPPPASPAYALLLVFSTVLDFVAGGLIHRLTPDLDHDDASRVRRAKRRRAALLWVSLVGNLGVLMYFKYVNFFIQAASDVAGAMGFYVPGLHLDVVLPLGISFYTFQSLSYTLDIHKRRLEPEPSFLRFALFVVFFPQLVAGPIVKASELLPQLRRGPRFSRAQFEEGAFRIVKGLAKKVVLGDWIAVKFTDRVFDAPGTFTTAELLVALYAYTLQIYADFSGYSDIAIGVGRLLGFELPENFDRPYQSKDIAEYWRRWHMTLSGWLRNYVFFPIIARLGARGGYVAVWLTMFLVGMWHGASWNFVIYANIHAGAVVFNRWNRVRKRDRPWWAKALLWTAVLAGVFGAMAWLSHAVLALDWPRALGCCGFAACVFALLCALPYVPPIKKKKGQPPPAIPWRHRLLGAVHIALTFHFVVLSRIFFRSPDLQTARRFVDGLTALDFNGIRPGLVGPWIWAALVGGLLLHFTPREWIDDKLLRGFRAPPGWALGILFALFGLGLMQLMQGSPRAFIYFQF